VTAIGEVEGIFGDYLRASERGDVPAEAAVA